MGARARLQGVPAAAVGIVRPCVSDHDVRERRDRARLADDHLNCAVVLEQGTGDGDARAATDVQSATDPARRSVIAEEDVPRCRDPSADVPARHVVPVEGHAVELHRGAVLCLRTGRVRLVVVDGPPDRDVAEGDLGAGLASEDSEDAVALEHGALEVEASGAVQLGAVAEPDDRVCDRVPHDYVPSHDGAAIGHEQADERRTSDDDRVECDR